jgi:TRAP-type uncharacterized transport system substrate-binding protein
MIRRFAALSLVALVVALVAAACGGDDPATTTVIVEKEVIKEVLVEVPVEVEKEVIREVEVEVVVEKEIIVQVTATPTQPAPTPTPRDPGDIEYEWRFVDAIRSYGFQLEGVREMLSRAYGDKISITPQDSTRLGAIQFVNDNPDMYPRTIFSQQELDIALWRAGGIAITGAPSAHKKPAALWSMYPAACVMFYSRDPEIKSVRDFDGKVVYVGSQGHTSVLESKMLFDAAGVSPSIVVGGKSGRDRLQDGEVDVTLYWLLFANSMGASEDPKTHTAMQLNGDWNFVDTPRDVIDIAGAANPAWVAAGALQPISVFKGGLRAAARINYDVIKEDGLTCIGSGSPTFHTSPDAPEDVVYATMKGIIDNIEVSDDYFSFMSKLWQTRLGHYGVPGSNFHPGAQRAYEEAGLNYGIEGIYEWGDAHPDGTF